MRGAATFFSVAKTAFSPFAFNSREFSGALGDIGVLLPLAAGLILINGLEAGTVFLTTGLVYLVTGLYFRLPVPVQPLKAMAAIAIAGRASAEELAAGGITVGVVLLILGRTSLAPRLAKAFAPWTIKGVQLGVGLLLIKGGIDFISKGGGQAFKETETAKLFAGNGAAFFVCATAVLALYLFRDNRRFGSAILVTAAGLLTGLWLGGTELLGRLSLGPSLPAFVLPSAASFAAALPVLVLPQLPVTFGNSVVATADAARGYYGPRSSRVTIRALCGTIGLADILTGLVGSMPVCHGSGGVTAHYRLGARTGAAPLFLGTALVGMALLFGNSAVNLLLLLPYPIIGAFMMYVGLEHARLWLALWRAKPALLVALMVGLVSLIWGNMALGLALGMGASLAAGGMKRAVPAFRQ